MPFSNLPDTARLWIYATDRPLTDAEEADLTRRLEDFLDDWSSHGRAVEGHAEVREGRFVLLAAHLPGHANGDVSGCGIDASVHVLEAFAQENELPWTSSLDVFYRDADGAVRNASRPDFQALSERGAVDRTTPVFDRDLKTVAALREGRFEHPAGESWHAEAFSLSTPPATAS